MPIDTTYRQKEAFTEQVIDANILNGILDDAIEWVVKNFRPGEIYSYDELADWAMQNGFRMEG